MTDRTGSGVSMRCRSKAALTKSKPSAFAGFRFPPEVIILSVHWYLRYGLSYRDLEELLVERGIEMDHVTLYGWVQGFDPELTQAARPIRARSKDTSRVVKSYFRISVIRFYRNTMIL